MESRLFFVILVSAGLETYKLSIQPWEVANAKNWRQYWFSFDWQPSPQGQKMPKKTIIKNFPQYLPIFAIKISITRFLFKEEDQFLKVVQSDSWEAEIYKTAISKHFLWDWNDSLPTHFFNANCFTCFIKVSKDSLLLVQDFSFEKSRNCSVLRIAAMPNILSFSKTKILIFFIRFRTIRFATFRRAFDLTFSGFWTSHWNPDSPKMPQSAISSDKTRHSSWYSCYTTCFIPSIILPVSFL